MWTIDMEDNFADVVGKAQRGLGIADAELAERAGISREALSRIKNERFDAAVLRKIAPVLGLDARTLAELPIYRPNPNELSGVAGFNTPYGGMRVNSYIVWDVYGGNAAAFDTGADAEPMLEFLRAKSLTLCGIFLTHSHGDHVAELDRLQNETGAPVWISAREPILGATPFDSGRIFECGERLRIETRSTWGHSRGGTTYVVRGLAYPVAVVGDAIFAGSMGGGNVSYADALRTNREEILTLPPETIICPGHGPLTTVAGELVHNPFFARS